MTQRAILCPRCRRLIGSDETVCSWCGTARSAPWWQFLNWTRGAMAGEWLVRSIITVNVVYFGHFAAAERRQGGFLSPGRHAA